MSTINVEFTPIALERRVDCDVNLLVLARRVGYDDLPEFASSVQHANNKPAGGLTHSAD